VNLIFARSGRLKKYEAHHWYGLVQMALPLLSPSFQALRHTEQNLHKKNRHIALVRQGKVLIVPLADAPGHELSAAGLEFQFNKIIEDAATTPRRYPIKRSPMTTGTPGWMLVKLRSLHHREGADLEEDRECHHRRRADDTKPLIQEDISLGTWIGDGRNRFYNKHQRAYLTLLYYG
jgi:hypothetical protein